MIERSSIKDFHGKPAAGKEDPVVKLKSAYAAGLQRYHTLNLCFLNEKTRDDLIEYCKTVSAAFDDSLPLKIMECDTIIAGLKDGEYLFMYLSPAEKHFILPVPEKEKT